MFYLDASLFFSLRDRGRAVSGSSLTGVRSLITLFSLRSSVPICSSLRGLGVRSSTSVRRDFFSIYFPSLQQGKEGIRDDYCIKFNVLAATRHKYVQYINHKTFTCTSISKNSFFSPPESIYMFLHYVTFSLFLCSLNNLQSGKQIFH